MLTESAARWLLVLHTGLGVAAVGAATHLLLWLWRRNARSARSAWLVVALLAGAFGVGLAMYPTYKVEVRAAYLESPGAVTAQAAAHQQDLERVAAREAARPTEPTPTLDVVRRAAQAARWFDVKEHWVALGLLCAFALACLLAVREIAESPVVRPVLLGLAGIVAGTTWLAAIVGVVVASYRAV